MILVLDSGPLGLVTNPTSSSSESRDCLVWLQAALINQNRVIVPEIVDYELRRELIRGNKREGLRRLDTLIAELTYDPITTPAMRKAAEFWAQARKAGRPSAPDRALDADMMLAAQAAIDAAQATDRVTIVTTNVRHLDWLTPARLWRDIQFS